MAPARPDNDVKCSAFRLFGSGRDCPACRGRRTFCGYGHKKSRAGGDFQEGTIESRSPQIVPDRLRLSAASSITANARRDPTMRRGRTAHRTLSARPSRATNRRSIRELHEERVHDIRRRQNQRVFSRKVTPSQETAVT